MKFPNHELFSGAESAYNHLSKILQETINEIAPIKDILIKGNTRSWFDSNIENQLEKGGNLKKGFYIRNCMLITSTSRNNET